MGEAAAVPRGPCGQTRANLMSDACPDASLCRSGGSPAVFDREATSSYNTALLAQILLAQSFCYGLSARIRRILQGVGFAAL